MHYRVNAGSIPRDHWLNDPDQGGGRILGEVCHFVDFLSFLAGAQPVEVHAQGVVNGGRYSGDNVVAWLEFANGSRGTITYLANGDRAFSKERVEAFGGGVAPHSMIFAVSNLCTMGAGKPAVPGGGKTKVTAASGKHWLGACVTVILLRLLSKRSCAAPWPR